MEKKARRYSCGIIKQIINAAGNTVLLPMRISSKSPAAALPFWIGKQMRSCGDTKAITICIQLIQRVTLPRGYECIDMYGHYTEDGRQICIPAHKWIGNESIGEGYYEYVMCRYDSQALTLIEKVIIDDPKKHWCKIDDTVPEIDPGEAESFQRIIDIVTDNLENKDFVDRMLGRIPEDNDPAVEEIMKLIFDNDDAE